ncbi:MAG: glucose 1-dehydrogenase [Alphaproteobacteria bacterium]|nr:glucose 1-dehydrogenase [Alphaproteobacteria bacterium]
MGVAGKTAIVTGAARGLGREYAVRLAAEGAAVVAADIADCGATVAAVEGAGGRALAATVDVTDAASTLAMADAALDRFGRIDILVNNAALYGALHGGRFEQLDGDEWDRCMAVNVKGLWHCCKAVVPAMREAGGGSIINIASVAALAGLPYALHYTTSKGAVIGLTRGLARELGRDGIRVNTVAPNMVMTEGTAEFFADKAERAAEVIRGNQALRKNLEVEDLSGTILYLAGDDSAFVTGQTISVDGGTVLL